MRSSSHVEASPTGFAAVDALGQDGTTGGGAGAGMRKIGA